MCLATGTKHTAVGRQERAEDLAGQHRRTAAKALCPCHLEEVSVWASLLLEATETLLCLALKILGEWVSVGNHSVQNCKLPRRAYG